MITFQIKTISNDFIGFMPIQSREFLDFKFVKKYRKGLLMMLTTFFSCTLYVNGFPAKFLTSFNDPYPLYA